MTLNVKRLAKWNVNNVSVLVLHTVCHIFAFKTYAGNGIIVFIEGFAQSHVLCIAPHLWLVNLRLFVGKYKNKLIRKAETIIRQNLKTIESVRSTEGISEQTAPHHGKFISPPSWHYKDSRAHFPSDSFSSTAMKNDLGNHSYLSP